MTRVIRIHSAILIVVWLAAHAGAVSGGSWNGVLVDAAYKPVPGVVLSLRDAQGGHDYTATTDADGRFAFQAIPAGSYEVAAAAISGEVWKSPARLQIKDTDALTTGLRLSPGHQIFLYVPEASSTAQASGGQHLSGTEVSSLPLNVRDFSKLLLLAAGTMTDTNGAANFTQQFAVNGQRGVATVFAMDGFDTTDAELGGATFSTFNVDAIEEVQSSSGVMPADIGQGAAGYTNVVTKSGVNQVHGSIFEFARNAAFDARNYFDITTNGRRIPPFVRNEFGLTNGGPVVIPGLYDGRNRTFYFGEYQGFRQVLGTTR